MKLKGFLKSFFILGLTLLPIFFTNASQYELNSPSVLNNLGSEAIFTFTNGVNFNINSQYYNYMVAGGYNSKYNLFWNNTGLYFVYSYNWGFTDLKQGYIKKFCRTTYNNVCNGSTVGVQWIDIQEFINNNSYTNADYFNSYYADTEVFSFCFGYESLNESICFLVNPYNSNTNSQYGGSLGITRNPNLADLPNDSIKNYFTTSPFSNTNKPIEYYYSTGSCPSVGQLKAGSNLTPAVCYAGYDGDLIYTAGENTTIQAGSGLNLFETYELFSGNMTIQNWYDTYWTYYNNISFNPYPFYNKPKALLGLMVARQSAGLTQGINGSYIILNYCYYIVNNTPDNQSTCVGSNVSTQYPGITLTDQDKKDIIDMVNDNYNVHTPGSGSIFLDPSQGLGGGGSSWGDECSGIPCLFEKFYQMFTSSRVNDVDFSQGGQGILPGYIALAFVIVVLFYVFKR